MSKETWILLRGEWRARINRVGLTVYAAMADAEAGLWRWMAEGRGGISTGKAATREEAMAAAEESARGAR